MKRQIRFRAWDKETKSLREVVRMDFDNKRFNLMMRFPTESAPQNWKLRKFEDVELMQFTGLTDKHGTDIYEGDIVRFADELFQIGFWRGWFNGMQLGWDGVSAPTKTGWINDSCEVIGNLYETPLKD